MGETTRGRNDSGRKGKWAKRLGGERESGRNDPDSNVSGRSCRISRLGTTDRTCLLGIMRGLRDLTGSKHQIERAYKVSRRRCMISRARTTRSDMPTRHPEGAARSHGFGTPDRTCLEGTRKGLHDLTGWELQIVHAYEISRPGCRVLRVQDPRSNIPKRYQDGTAISHGFGPIDSTCIQGIRSGLQDLKGKAHQIELTNKV